MYQQFSPPCPIIMGKGSISILGDKIKEFGCKKPLVVFDKGIEDAGIAAKAFKVLEAAGLDYVAFNGVISDPPDSVVDMAGELGIKEGADCIIGLGGGSSIDTAKAAAILFSNPGPVKKYILAQPIPIDTKVPLFLVPTTAGTGSESTTVAVISRPDENAKWSVYVNTTLAIIDPELMATLAKAETVNTGLDAFAHAAEGMTSVNWNYHADLMAEAAIKKISAYLQVCYDEPNNVDARHEMALAANWAGLAFKDPLTHVGHSVSDALSCHFHVPHGLGCALALPETMRLIAPVEPVKMKIIAEAMGLPLTGNETGEQLGVAVSDAIRAMMHSMNMTSLKSLGYSREDIVALYPDVVSNHLASLCPVKITDEVAKKLLGDVYDTYQ